MIVWRARNARDRLARAVRYATGKTTPADARKMLWEMENIAGCWPLACISTESVLERALDVYEANPALEALCDDAASRVADKWNDSGDSTSAAIDWAMELVQRYAIDAGVELTERETEDA
jgi:hypothetical protein